MGSTADWWYKDRLPELQRELEFEKDPEKREAIERKMRGELDPPKKDAPGHTVEIDIDDKHLFDLMFMAHENDVTLNQLIHQVLENQLKDNEYTFENGTKPKFLVENK